MKLQLVSAQKPKVNHGQFSSCFLPRSQFTTKIPPNNKNPTDPRDSIDHCRSLTRRRSSLGLPCALHQRPVNGPESAAKKGSVGRLDFIHTALVSQFRPFSRDASDFPVELLLNTLSLGHLARRPMCVCSPCLRYFETRRAARRNCQPPRVDGFRESRGLRALGRDSTLSSARCASLATAFSPWTVGFMSFQFALAKALAWQLDTSILQVIFLAVARGLSAVILRNIS